MAFGVAAEIFEQHVVTLGRRQFDEALGPELLEAGKGDAIGRRARADLVVDPLAPAHLVAIAGERRFVAQAPRQRAEDVEVVPGLADRIDGAMHGKDEGTRDEPPTSLLSSMVVAGSTMSA
jgi:hypothetical protein